MTPRRAQRALAHLSRRLIAASLPTCALLCALLCAPLSPSARAQVAPPGEGVLPSPPPPPARAPAVDEELAARLLSALLRALPPGDLSPAPPRLLLLNEAGAPTALSAYRCPLPRALSGLAFQEAALREVGAEAWGYFDFAAWGALLGGEARGGARHDPTLGLFNHASPLAAQWFGVLPLKPRALVAGHRAQDIYDVVFRGATRALAEAHAFLLAAPGRLVSERAAYEEAMRLEHFSGPDYIATRFHGVPLRSSAGRTEGSLRGECAPPYAELGFWLRRETDGTREALWGALERLLATFDPGYLAALRQRRFPDTPRPAVGGAVSLERLARLYAGWLTDPYEYMFEGEGQVGPVRAGRLQLGEYLGGVNGLLYYGGLMSAVAEELRAPEPEWGDPRLLARLSGRPIERPLTPEERAAGRRRPFTYYNPALIQWGIDQLVPPPDLKIGERTAQELYDLLMRRLFRLMAKSYLHLQRERDVNAERLEYALAMLSPEFDALEYLPRRFAGALPEFAREESSALQPWGALGFWVRREIDGTALLLWGGLRVVLGRFDGEFLRGL